MWYWVRERYLRHKKHEVSSKKKITRLDFIKTKTFALQETLLKRLKATDKENKLAQHKSGNGLVSKIYKKPSKIQNIFLKTLSKTTQFLKMDKTDRYEETCVTKCFLKYMER